MNKDNVIFVELEYQASSAKRLIQNLLALKGELRPTHQSIAEDGPGIAIDSGDFDGGSFEMPSSGMFLKGSGILYDIRRSRQDTILCDAYVEESVIGLVKRLLIGMADKNAIFGFACEPDERERRNRITTRLGVNTIESWVGRDPQRYVPGLYWWTLISEGMATKLGLAISEIVCLAKEEITLESGARLIRFYDMPRDWQSADGLVRSYPTLRGVFDVEKIRPTIEKARNFLELSTLVHDWP